MLVAAINRRYQVGRGHHLAYYDADTIVVFSPSALVVAAREPEEERFLLDEDGRYAMCPEWWWSRAD